MKKKTKKISFCNILLFLSHLRSFLLIFLGQKTKIEKFIFLRGEPLSFKKKIRSSSDEFAMMLR